MSGPEVIRAGEQWPKAWEPSREGGGSASGVVGLHRKGLLPGKLFSLSRNGLAPGGTVPSGSKRPQMSKPLDQKHMVNRGTE